MYRSVAKITVSNVFSYQLVRFLSTPRVITTPRYREVTMYSAETSQLIKCIFREGALFVHDVQGMAIVLLYY